MKLHVLVACEESQAVTKAFRALGHIAYSCDIQECSGGYPEWHIQHDALEIISSFRFYTQDGREHFIDSWDLLIGHPPCTYIAYSGGAHWHKPGRLEKRLDALKFFGALWNSYVPFIALENPKSCASPVIAKYSQEIQPYFFGDPAMKTTWLWLKNLPPYILRICFRSLNRYTWIKKANNVISRIALRAIVAPEKRDQKHSRVSPKQWRNNGAIIFSV